MGADPKRVPGAPGTLALLPFAQLMCAHASTAAGAGLFAPNGKAPGVTSWQDLKGKTVCGLTGYYGKGPSACQGGT